MFIGHFGVALMAKPIAPKISLGTLMLASWLPDLLAFVFLMAGIEHFSVQPGITAGNPLNVYDIPLSHSLAMDVVWGGLLAGTYFTFQRYMRGTVIIFLTVISHWLLDLVSHRPDITLAPGVNIYVGLGLYDSVRATLIVEGLLWLIGVAFYAYTTHAEKKSAAYAFWGVVVIVTVLWASGIAGPPPPNIASVEITNVIIFSLVLAWSYWIDRTRSFAKPDEILLERARF